MWLPLTQASRKTVLKRLIGSGFQIAPDALDYIMGLETPLLVVDTIIAECKSGSRPPVLSLDYVMGQLLADSAEEPDIQEILGEEIIEEKPVSFVDETPEPIGGWAVEVIKNPSREDVGSEGIVEDFLALFKDRYRRINAIYMSRIDTQGAITPSAAGTRRSDARRVKPMDKEGKRSRRPPSQKVIGMVKNKNISRSRNVIVELEDLEDSIISVIPAGREGLAGQQLSEKANSILQDEVVCLSGFIDEDGRMIADDVIFPDIPTARQAGRARSDVYAVFVSDLHCGSLEFLEDEFDRFIDWIRGRDCDSSEKRMVDRIKYLFIAGDLIDGIGVYPGQLEDLAIPSLYDQYAKLAKKLRKLPERIKLICIPGNHDACRQALPKPPISDDFAKSLYDLGDQILMAGDPCHLRVEGVDILLTHGDSLDDMVTNSPGASYKEPAVPMKSLLQKRHLAPIYGGKTELAPLHRDWMVIDIPPDIIHFGHAHHNAVDNYRGVQIINSGTFQSQTEFMRKQGVVPTPGIVTILNLRTGAPELKMFYDLSQLATGTY